MSFHGSDQFQSTALFKLLVLPMGLVAFTGMAIEGASAHDKDCDGNPVLGRIKVDCCGEAEEHQLKPEQISRGPNEEYIVSFESVGLSGILVCGAIVTPMEGAYGNQCQRRSKIASLSGAKMHQ